MKTIASRHWGHAVLAAACVSVALALGLPGCALPTAPQSATIPESGALLVTPVAHVPWTPLLWPGKQNAPFVLTTYEGRPALHVRADRSMSVLRQRLSEHALQPAQIRFSWAVDRLFADADIGVAGQDDAPVRVVLAFDGDRSRLSPRARMQSELSRTLLGEDMPYATLTYVWCNTRPVGTVLVSPRTDRVRKMVVESGADRVGRWLEYERDVAQDFRAVFGEEPGPLIGIALMTDADNTGERINAWYGALHLTSR